MSDKQDAFVKAIAAEFPEVPHRYCDNHFLRDLAKPVLEADSHAKVQMRKKVRGLRKIEQAVLKRQRVEATENAAGDDAEATITVTVGPAAPPLPEEIEPVIAPPNAVPGGSTVRASINAPSKFAFLKSMPERSTPLKSMLEKSTPTADLDCL